MKPLRILALEPYLGGSHQAFLEGWAARSRHDFEIHGLPPRKWKWRMRHAAIHFAHLTTERRHTGAQWDLIFCSDMLNLAEFLGLCPKELRQLPAVAYFHENQLSYPVQEASQRDYQFAFTNLTTALAATEVWFNSAFHRDDFLTQMEALLRRMPDHRPLFAIDEVRTRARVQHPGVPDPGPRTQPRPRGPLHILWAARWEHDKNPEDLLEAVTLLKERGCEFQLSVIGEHFRSHPPAFETLETHHAQSLKHFGWLPSRAEYEHALHEADVFISTAHHEFYGLAAAEAILAEAHPLLPERLAYPELLGSDAAQHLYPGDARSLADALEELIKGHKTRALQSLRAGHLAKAWEPSASRLDDALESLILAHRD